MKLMIILGSFFISTLCFAQNSNVKSQIVGKWYMTSFSVNGKTQVIPPSVQANAWMEFNSDGGCSYVSPSTGQITNCTWSYNPTTNILTQQNLGSTTDPDEDTVTSISATSMTLTDKADGVVASLIR